MDNYKLYANLIRKPDSNDLNAVPCEVENDCWQLIREDEFDGEFPEPDEEIGDDISM